MAGVTLLVVAISVTILSSYVAGTRLFVVALLIALAVIIALSLDNKINGRDPFSVLHLIAYYVFANGTLGLSYLGMNTDSRERFGYDLNDLTYAGILILSSFVTLASGYLLLGRVSWPRCRDMFRGSSWDNSRIVFLLGVGWLARITLIADGRYFHNAQAAEGLISGRVTFLLTAASLLPTLATFLLLALIKGSPLRAHPLVLLAAVAEVAWAAPSGARAGVISLVLGFLAVRFYSSGRRVPLQLVLVAVAVSAVAFPLIANYRVAGDTASDQSYYAQSEQAEDGPVSEVASSVLARFSDAEAVATTIHNAPYVEGLLTFDRLGRLTASQLVPRLVLPTKEDANLFGNEFGRRTRIINESDYRTSINAPLAAMWWLVGGIGGVLLGSFVTGMLFKLLDAVVSFRSDGKLGTAVFSVLAFSITTIPATILPAGAAGVLKSGAVLCLLSIVVFQWGKKREGKLAYA